jgi:hypothetical protein
MFDLDINPSRHSKLVDVNTTSHRGFTPEELAEQCVKKIISVSDTAPPAIKEQAIAFGTRIEKIIARYMLQAISSDRTTVYNALNDSGNPEMAELIRRL